MNNDIVYYDNEKNMIDTEKLCSLDFAVIEKRTTPIMFRQARFIYVREGSGTLLIDNIEHRVEKNTLIAALPWKILEWVSVKDTLQLVIIAYNYEFINIMLKSFNDFGEKNLETSMLFNKKPLIYLDSIQNETVSTIFDVIKTEIGVESIQTNKPTSPLYRQLVSCKLMELVILYRRYATYDMGDMNKLGDEETLLNYIYMHSHLKLTLDDVANKFFVSKSKMSRMISDMTGTTFLKLINNIRIEKACNYLAYTGLSLKEIAETVGFNDSSHLIKTFENHMGISPIQYRKDFQDKKTKYSEADKEIAFEIIDYIYLNYFNEEINQHAVSEMFNINLRKMNQLITYYADNSFDNLLNIVRINNACVLLSTTNKMVSEIAYEVGYKNVKTFNINFNKYKSITPTQYLERVSLHSI